MRQYQRAVAHNNSYASLHVRQDRVRNPSLTVLLAVEVRLMFVLYRCRRRTANASGDCRDTGTGPAYPLSLNRAALEVP